ncbi:MAG: hypothetical protein M1834_000407 [Cirrosporium novae-zelandiae]|nr:MAG: hypothetical protein M1834_000407 [Cirrosporium novae-zelandiae]
MDVFWAAPPVSRTLTAATLLTSCLAHSGILDIRFLIFYSPWIFQIPPQLWRLFTPFLVTGGGLGILFDTYFLYTYGSELEKNSSSRFPQPGDFFTYICFVALTILFSAGFLLGGFIFMSALTLALAYTYSQDNRGRKVTFFIVQIPVQFLPYAMLLMTLVMAGPQVAIQQATGLVAGHLYDFLTRLWPTFGGGRNYIQTPRIVKRLFGADRPAYTARGFGTAYRPGTQQPSRGTTTGFSRGISSVWNSRGPGRRLGGD